MSIEPGLVLAGMLVIGFLCQWPAWRVKLPAIVFLLLAGLLLGPVLGLLHPDRLLGPPLFPMVLLAVALVLFEAVSRCASTSCPASAGRWADW